MTNEAPKRRNTGLIILIAVIAGLLLLCCALLLVAAFLFPRVSSRTGPGGFLSVPGSGGAVEATRELDRAFPVQGAEVSNQVGDVIIEGTDDGQVVVEALVRGYGATTDQAQRAADDVEVTVEQQGEGRIRAEARTPQGLRFQGRSPTVRFMIRVPREVTLQMSNNVGRIEVTDVVGSAMITSDVGDVVVRRFTMRDDTRIEGNVGRILVELPSNAAFIVDAETNVGDIDTAFDVRGATPERRPPGDRLQGEVGENPQWELRLRTNTGDISIEAD